MLVLLVLTMQMTIITAATEPTYFFNVEVDYDDEEFTISSVELFETIALCLFLTQFRWQ